MDMKFLKYNPFNLNNLGVKPIYRVSKSVRERERETERYSVLYLGQVLCDVSHRNI